MATPFKSLHFYESRVKTITATFRQELTGYGNRGQISADADLDEVLTYATLGVAHAHELRQVWQNMLDVLPKAINVLDIGCGCAFTPAVLFDENVTVHSYQGFDHSDAMVWIGSRLNLEHKLVCDIDEIDKISNPILVVLNHVFGQESVTEKDFDLWIAALHRVAGSGFDLLSLEILNFAPCIEKRSQFKKLLVKSGWSVDVVKSIQIPGMHTSLKTAELWRVVRV